MHSDLPFARPRVILQQFRDEADARVDVAAARHVPERGRVRVGDGEQAVEEADEVVTAVMMSGSLSIGIFANTTFALRFASTTCRFFFLEFFLKFCSHEKIRKFPRSIEHFRELPKVKRKISKFSENIRKVTNISQNFRTLPKNF